MLISGERIMRRTRPLAAAFALLTLTGHAFTGSAQTAQPKPELLLFHPSGPPLSYEVEPSSRSIPNPQTRWSCSRLALLSIRSASAATSWTPTRHLPGPGRRRPRLAQQGPLQHQRQVPRRPRSRIPEDDLRRPPRPGPRHAAIPSRRPLPSQGPLRHLRPAGL